MFFVMQRLQEQYFAKDKICLVGVGDEEERNTGNFG